MKKAFLILIAAASIAVLLVACGGSSNTGGNNGGSNNGGGNSGGSGNTVTVTANATNFAQTDVTLSKGQTLQVTNAASTLHILSLGRWQNSVAHPEQEAGAPSVNNVQLSANSNTTIGPWNTSGTYYIYCTVHPNMNLKVTVQ